MLKIEFKDANCREAPLSDIDKIFQELEYKDTPLVRQFIEEIEHGKYYDTSDFIDRFDRHLSISDMSTGCKAAIILALGYRKPLDLTECGKNARDSIVQNCTSGHILLVDDLGLVKTHLIIKNSMQINVILNLMGIGLLA